MVYLSLEQILYLHEESIRQFGGTLGARSMELVKAAVLQPMQTVFGEDAYPTLFDKAAVLLHAIAKNHPFLDGNKRTAFISANIMLAVNGYKMTATNEEAIDFMLSVASSNKNKIQEIATWLKKHSRKSQAAQ